MMKMVLRVLLKMKYYRYVHGEEIWWKPIEYVAMALSGEMQAYCDIEDEMVKGMFGTIVQGYLKKGYNRATAEMMAREFFRYGSWNNKYMCENISGWN